MDLTHKILNNNNLQTKVNYWKKFEKRIVFTNGCFDLLHLGHLHTLTESKKLGDILIIGLNSDNSIKRLKGESRPIQNQQTRSTILANLQIVDAVVLFEENTPLNLIKTILPQILVKGGDYKIEDIVGADLVLKNGGQVKTIPLLEGISTTNSINKVNNQV